MADFGRAKGRVLVLPSGLTVVPYHMAGSGFHCVVIAHTVLGTEPEINFIGRHLWVPEADIIEASVVPSTSIIGLAAAYGSTH